MCYPQVTLEEQTICGALQTLNEEALEDVLQSEPAHSGEPLRAISEDSDAAPAPDTAPAGGAAAAAGGGGERRDHVVNFHDDVFM